MVMHARKVARLDDGLRYFYRYRDLNQPEILPKDKGLSNTHSAKYTDRKASKFDGFDRRRSNSPRSFHSRSGHYDNKPRERRNYEDIDNRDSKTKEQKHKDHKSEVHRLAERVCGDWSEHISKSGKRYFYNCRTEVSQWEKPECWNEENSTSTRNNDKVQHDASDRSKSSSSSKANSHGESRHSNTNNNKTLSASKSTSRKDSRDARGSVREEQKPSPKNASSATSKDAGPASFGDRTSRQDRKRPYSRRSASRSPARSQKSGKYGSRGSSSELGSGRNGAGGRNDSSAGNGGTVGRRDGPTESAEFESSETRPESKEIFESHKALPLDSPVHEDMDISPENSFSQTEVEMRTSHDGLNSKSSPKTSAPVPPGISIVAMTGNDGETDASQSERPSLAPSRVQPPSKQDSSYPPSASTPGPAVPNASSARGGANSSNLQQQQSLQTTLAGLEQAVLRLDPDEATSSVSGQQGRSGSQANFASCLALLPVLLTQLSNRAGPGGNDSDNQLIIQQVIPLLKKLQEIVVHQQQQQQQMKLQQAIIQLLQMQNLGGSGGVHANAGHKTPGNDDKAESPYSPPDSDGSPVQTPSHGRHYPHHRHNRQSTSGNRQSPRQHQYHQESGHQVPISKSTRQEKAPHQGSVEESDDRTDAAPFNADVHSKMENRNHGRPSVNSQLSTSSAGSQTPSHHPVVPSYRKNDVELTPSLINHFNPNVIDHVTNWQADTLVKQADCIASDNYSYLGPLCSQVSVELKQARSMVRAQEILSTRNEQRRIFIQHQLYELDKDLPVPCFLTPNPVVVTFPQQQQHQHVSVHVTPGPQQQAAVPHPLSGPAAQPNPVPTPLSPQVTPVQIHLPIDPSSPVPPPPTRGASAAPDASREGPGSDLT